MKTCNLCKEDKPLSEFHKNKFLKSGYANRCKVCQKTYNDKYNTKEKTKTKQRRRRKANQAFINRIKTFFGCTICGYNKHAVALDFDHIDPSTKKRGNYSAVNSSWSRKMIKEEVRKCRILCSNCHRCTTHGIEDPL
jgi:hypothetical protein